VKTQRFPFGLSYWTNDVALATVLKAGQHFRFDLDAVNDFCLGDLPRQLVDLLRVASAVYVVDRLVRRKPKDSPKAAARTIGVKVEVLQASLWNRQEVRDALHDALEFVTGDFWDIQFERDLQEYKWPTSYLPFSKTDGSPLVCLFSGGLDSAAGLAARMNMNPARPIIPVTVWHQPRQRHLVQHQYELLRRQYRREGFRTHIDPLVVKVAMMWKTAAEERNRETSQRSRSFLFTALGAITADMHCQQTVEVFESGVGAINLPLMAGMVGSKATRSAHPEFLRRMSKLTSLVADSEIVFSLPFEDRTKGEIANVLTKPELRQLACMSASCVHFPIRHKDHKQCGLCPACIFRRAALYSAGIQEPDDTYSYDFLGAAERINALPEKRLAYLKAFLLQVARLQDIENHDRLPPAFERHLIGTGILQRDQSQRAVVELLARYRNEWMKIAADAREQGHAWARLLAPKQLASRGLIDASA
jgi:7-cyano-7-deazaguanine synthase in queuosine biosynthesis